jgi:hypothetical protein
MNRRLSPVFPIALVIILNALAIPLNAQSGREDYDDADPWLGFESTRPAADSAAIARFLNSLAGTDPVVCQLAVSSIGNHWGPGDSDNRIGLLSDEASEHASRDALGQSVTDPAALSLLTAVLGGNVPVCAGPRPGCWGKAILPRP